MAQLRITTSVAAVLTVFLAEPDSPRYGLELMHATGQPSGTLYPILTRLQQAGWVAAEWETADPSELGRPPRRYYRLTPDGAASARSALAALRRSLGITGNPATGLA
ncbi:PadR family transcriptional regulator [Actinocatenispora sera]|uniref:PadR family transcriptional regulator n=1 Tax=Actinocatenispora sera TaxID=390989 RepID=UPI0033EF0D88